MNIDPFYLTATRTLTVLIPELIVLATATVMMTAGAFVRLPRRTWCAIAAVGLIAALVALRIFWMFSTDPFTAVALNDDLSKFGRAAFLFTGLILLGLGHDQVDDHRAAEFFGALLMIVGGSMLVCAANDLVFLFVGLEMVSIPTYLLLYLPRRNAITQEAATKYFFLSIFSSGLLLFGLAYLYGLTGVSNLKGIMYLFQSSPAHTPFAFGLIAVVFVMAGLGFRVAAVPFHFYAPDVYQGSPLVMAGLLSWIPKGIGFVAMIRVLTGVFGGSNDLASRAVILAWILAVATMTLGNTVALLQDNLKRLLAYSSIAHAGYLLVGIAAAFRDQPALSGAASPYPGAQGIVFYLAAYALMTLGVFGIILAVNTPERPVETVDDLAGLARSHPLAAFGMALCLFSLAGVPPLAGFWGKFQIFASALSASPGFHAERRLFQILAVIGVLNAAIGAYYYLRIVVVMYLRPAPETRTPLQTGWPTALAAGTCAALSLILGLMPDSVNSAANLAAIAATTKPEPTPLPEAASPATANAVRPNVPATTTAKVD
jgi:NADH-quinone oxidoreductase subunit N